MRFIIIVHMGISMILHEKSVCQNIRFILIKAKLIKSTCFNCKKRAFDRGKIQNFSNSIAHQNFRENLMRHLKMLCIIVIRYILLYILY